MPERSNMIAVMINGEVTQTAATTLSALLVSLDMANKVVATALNGDFVPLTKRDETVLRPNDQIEIVTPRQGG